MKKILQRPKNRENLLILGLAVCCAATCFFFEPGRRHLVYGEMAYLAAVALVTGLLWRRKIPVNWSFVILAVSLVVRIGYIFATPVWVRQHDFIDFGVGFGHGGYIEYLYRNRHLPDFDPREVWAFFQPPLHHILAAVWLFVQESLGVVYRHAQENVQALTMFYSGCTAIFSYKIFREFRLKGTALLVATALVAFHPSLILFSGSLNNDALCLMFEVMALYFTVRWYRESKLKNILYIAVTLGLSMMAKLAGAMIAPAIALVFLVKWVKDKGCFKKYLGQFAAFGAVCAPLGLWSPIRNLVLFGVPLNYTPAVGEPVGSYSVLERLFDVRIRDVFAAMINNGDAYDDYNIPVSLLKTALFGETNLSHDVPYIAPFARVLFWVNLVLVLLSLAAMLYYLIRRNDHLEPVFRGFFAVYYVVSMAFYLNFNFSMPFFSTQDFRYIVQTVLMGALFIGFLVQDTEKGGGDRVAAGEAQTGAPGAGVPRAGARKRLVRYAVVGLTAVFCLCSSAVYLLLVVAM